MNVSSLTSGHPHLQDKQETQYTQTEGQARNGHRPSREMQQQTLDPALGKFYGPISDDLLAVEQRLSEELSSRHPQLKAVLEHGTQLGGKRLRPAMVLLFGEAVGSITSHHRTIATVIEMVHTATLIHDDVLDQADSRRHVPTINAVWDAHTSILVGDYLFSQAYRLAASTESTIACEKVGEAARKVCEGELRQVLLRDHLSLDEPTYVSILEAKTGELCRVACELGATLAGGSQSEIKAAAEFGNSLGIAFQIADDYLDIWGDDQVVGKTLGTDIEQGKTTLPIIRLLDEASVDERREIESILHGPIEDRAERILPLLEESDARHYTRSVAKLHHRNAMAALDHLPNGEAKACLKAMADFSISRKF